MDNVDLKQVAAQLRKPEGDFGREVGRKMNEGNRAMNLHTLAVVNPEAGDRILEIGMGNGYFVKNIVGVENDIHYTGCDYSSDMVREAGQLNDGFIKQGKVRFHQASILEMPFGENSFNKIFTINTLYFWDDHQAALREICRVLKSDGKFLLSVRPKRIMEKIPITRHGFKLFGEEEILDLLSKAGFSSIERTHVVEPKDVFSSQLVQNKGNITTSERECLIFSCSNSA